MHIDPRKCSYWMLETVVLSGTALELGERDSVELLSGSGLGFIVQFINVQ
jgi:hypothetical protein